MALIYTIGDGLGGVNDLQKMGPSLVGSIAEVEYASKTDSSSISHVMVLLVLAGLLSA